MSNFPSLWKLYHLCHQKYSSLFNSPLFNHLHLYWNGPHLPMLFSSEGCTNSFVRHLISFCILSSLSFTSLYTFTYMFALLLNHLFTYIQLFHRNPVFFCSICVPRPIRKTWWCISPFHHNSLNVPFLFYYDTRTLIYTEIYCATLNALFSRSTTLDGCKLQWSWLRAQGPRH